MRLVRALVLAVGLSAAALAADGYEAGAQQPMLGVEMSPVPVSVQTAQGLDPNDGTYVRNVFPGTAADAMGVQPGDVIRTVNGRPIASMTDLRNEVGSQSVGDPVAVVVRRNGQDVPLQSTLREWPQNIPREPIDAAAEQRFKDWQRRRLARQRDDIQEIGERVAALRDQLAQAQAKPPAPFTAAPALRDAERLLRFLPAWKLDYRYDTTGIRPAPGPQPLARSAEVASADDAWVLRVELTSGRPPVPPRLIEL